MRHLSRGPFGAVSHMAMVTALSASAIVLLASEAMGQSKDEIVFNIPSGSLAQALVAFGSQSGTQISYESSIAAGKTFSGMRGSATREQAVSRILQGTGLIYGFAGTTNVLIERPTASAGKKDDKATDGTIVLDPITITGNSANTKIDATYSSARSSTYITQEKIEQFRGTSTGDFLKGQAGILTGDNRNSGAVDINVRGMQGFGRVPVVVDGAQQQNTVYRGYSGVASRNYIDPDMIGGVEIVKGPSAGVYGVGATGGVAIMRTLTADDIIKEGEDMGWRVRGSMMGNTSSPPADDTPGGLRPFEKSYITDCNWDCGPVKVPDEVLNTDVSTLGGPAGMDRPAFLKPTSGSGSVAFAKRWEGLEVVGAYSRRKIGNYHAGKRGDTPGKIVTETRDLVSRGWPGQPDQWTQYTDVKVDGLTRYRAGEEVLNTSQDNKSYLLKSKLTLDGGHTFDVGYMKYKSEFGELMPSVMLWIGGALQAPLSEVEVDTYTARYNWKPDDSDLINLTANLWHTKTETQIRTPYKFGTPDQPMDFPSGYWDVAKRTGFDISNESIFDTRWGDVTLNYGGSYTYETLAPPDDFDELKDTVKMFEAARDGWRKETSAFVSGEWKPIEWLKFDGALRYTKTHSHDNTKQQIVGPDYDYANARWVNNDDRNSGFAPIVATTIEPIDGLQFYARYAEAIRSPSLFESTSGFSFSPDPITGIKPEHAKNWEFGANLKMDSVFDTGDELRFKAAYFNNNIENYLTRGFNARKGYDVTMRNLKHARFKGIELSGRYDMGSFYAEASGIYYTDTEFCSEESVQGRNCFADGTSSGFGQLHVPPKQTGSVILGMRMFEDALNIGTRISYTGKRPADLLTIPNGSQTTMVTWSQYTLVDLFGSYKINEDTTFDFSVDNLTDVYYMDALTLGLMPSPGRTFRAGLTAKF